MSRFLSLRAFSITLFLVCTSFSIAQFSSKMQDVSLRAASTVSLKELHAQPASKHVDYSKDVRPAKTPTIVTGKDAVSFYRRHVADHLDYSKKVRSTLSLEVNTRGAISLYGQNYSLDLGPVAGVGSEANLGIGSFLIKARGCVEKSKMTYFTRKYSTFYFVAQSLYEVGVFPGYRIPLRKGGELQVYLGGEYLKMKQDTRGVYSKTHGNYCKSQERIFATLGAKAVSYPLFPKKPNITVGGLFEVSALGYGVVDVEFLRNIYSGGIRLHAAAQINRHTPLVTFFLRPFAKAETCIDISYDDKKDAPAELDGATFEIFAGIETGILF